MSKSKKLDLQVEQLDDRIMPSTGLTGSGLSWTYSNNRIIINGTAGSDSFQLMGGTTLSIFDFNDYSNHFHNTGVNLGANLKIQIKGGEGNDYIVNGLAAGQYQQALITE